MIEDQQRQMESKMHIAEAEREASMAEEAQARMSVGRFASSCHDGHCCMHLLRAEMGREENALSRIAQADEGKHGRCIHAHVGGLWKRAISIPMSPVSCNGSHPCAALVSDRPEHVNTQTLKGFASFVARFNPSIVSRISSPTPRRACLSCDAVVCNHTARGDTGTTLSV